MSLQRTHGFLVPSNTALVSVQVARALLGLDRETVSDLIESGDLLWAFDLAARGAGDRQSVHVWVDCLLAKRHGLPQPAMSATDAVDQIVGFPGSPFVTAANLAIRFNVDRSTVFRWIHIGDIQGKTVGHELRADRGSVMAFLIRRRSGSAGLASSVQEGCMEVAGGRGVWSKNAS